MGVTCTQTSAWASELATANHRLFFTSLYCCHLKEHLQFFNGVLIGTITLESRCNHQISLKVDLQ